MKSKERANELIKKTAIIHTQLGNLKRYETKLRSMGFDLLADDFIDLQQNYEDLIEDNYGEIDRLLTEEEV